MSMHERRIDSERRKVSSERLGPVRKNGRSPNGARFGGTNGLSGPAGGSKGHSPTRDQSKDAARSKSADICISLCPAGSVEPPLLKEIATRIAGTLGVSTEISSGLMDIRFARHAGRKQYDAGVILEKLLETDSPSGRKILAVTHGDLFIPILTHVRGEARLGGRACIVSTFRFRGDAAVEGYLDRLVKEALHQLGHAFGLCHCRDPLCVMHPGIRGNGGERRSDLLCGYCRIMFEDRLKRLSGEAAPAAKPGLETAPEGAGSLEKVSRSCAGNQVNHRNGKDTKGKGVRGARPALRVYSTVHEGTESREGRHSLQRNAAHPAVFPLVRGLP